MIDEQAGEFEYEGRKKSLKWYFCCTKRRESFTHRASHFAHRKVKQKASIMKYLFYACAFPWVMARQSITFLQAQVFHMLVMLFLLLLLSLSQSLSHSFTPLSHSMYEWMNRLSEPSTRTTTTTTMNILCTSNCIWLDSHLHLMHIWYANKRSAHVPAHEWHLMDIEANFESHSQTVMLMFATGIDHEINIVEKRPLK